MNVVMSPSDNCVVCGGTKQVTAYLRDSGFVSAGPGGSIYADPGIVERLECHCENCGVAYALESFYNPPLLVR